MSRFREARALFDGIVELPRAEREAALAERCADPGLRAQVAAMLRADEESGVFDHGLTTGIGAAVVRDLAAIDTPPERLGTYQIVGRLGAGGMGVVYEAVQERPRRRVALKTLLPWLRKGAPLEWFETEAQAMARLVHPGIPQVYEVFEHEGRPWLAMERVQGVPLDAWAAVRTPRARVEAMAKVCDAVAHAHRSGVVHGDLKPGNVLVTAEGQPKVLDFGLARLRDEAIGGPTAAGTPAFCAPEQLSGAAATPAADVYALGVVLYSLLDGHLPFQVRPDAPLALGDRDAPPTLRGFDGLDRVVARALAPAPEDRYGSAEELGADLDRWLADRPVRAAPVDVRYRLRTALRRHRAVIRGVGMLAVLALGVVAIEARSGHLRDIAHQDAARARWALAAVEMAERVAAGDVDEARRVSERFAADAENAGTLAAATAWTDLARALEDHEHGSEATFAWATAWALGAPDVRLPLARRLALEWRWAAVANLLDDPDSAEELALRATAESALRRGEGGSIVDAFRTGTATQWGADTQVFSAGSALFAVDPAARRIAEVARDAALTVVRELPVPPDLSLSWTRVVLLDGPTLVLRTPDVVIAWSLYEGRELGRWPILGTIAVTAWRWPGDPTPWLLVGTGPYTRMLRAVRPGSSEILAPAPALDRVRSDVGELYPYDIDADGADELLVAHGAWRGFEVRILEAGPDRTFTLAASAPTGQPTGFVPVGGGVAFTSSAPDLAGSDLFQRTRPPSGFGLLRGDRDGTVRIEQWWDGPETAQAWGTYGDGAADLDGDGDGELLAGSGPPWRMLVLRPGGGDPVPLDGVAPLGAWQLDADRADEVVVRVEGSSVLWTLGTGDTLLPPIRVPPRPTPPDAVDPDLAAPWHRARQLASLSLTEAAASALQALAVTAVHPEDRAALLREAAVLADAMQLPFVAAGYTEEASRAVTPTPAQAAADDERRRGLLAPDTPPRALPLDDGLDGWTITAPEALRTGAKGLEVELYNDLPELARLALRRTSGPLALEADIDVSELHAGAALSIGFSTPAGVLAGYISASGGGGRERSAAGFRILDELPRQRQVRVLGHIRVELRVDLEHLLAIGRTTLGGAGHIEPRWDLPAEVAGAPLALVLGCGAASFPRLAHGRARIERLAIAGAEPVPVAASARNLLVADRLGAAAARGDELPATLAAWVSAEIGDRADALARLRAAPVDATTAIHLLRSRPERASPLLRDALGPSVWAGLVARAWNGLEPSTDPTDFLLDSNLDALTPDSVDSQLLILARARTFLEHGDVDRARREAGRLLGLGGDAQPMVAAQAAILLAREARDETERARAVAALFREAPSASFAGRLLKEEGL